VVNSTTAAPSIAQSALTGCGEGVAEGVGLGEGRGVAEGVPVGDALPVGLAVGLGLVLGPALGLALGLAVVLEGCAVMADPPPPLQAANAATSDRPKVARPTSSAFT